MLPSSPPRLGRSACLLCAALVSACSTYSDDDASFLDQAGDDATALSVSCAGRDPCSGGGDVYSSAYRVGLAPTARADLVQTFVGTAAGTPRAVRVVARQLRPFAGEGSPRLVVQVLGPLAEGSLNLQTAGEVLGGSAALSTLNGLVEVALSGAGQIESGRLYALRFSLDGVTGGTDQVLVGVGALTNAAAYPAGEALRSTARSATAWGEPLPTRHRPAGAFDVAFGFLGGLGSACLVGSECGSRQCQGGQCVSFDPAAVMTVTGEVPVAFGVVGAGATAERTFGLRNDVPAGGDALTVTASTTAPFEVTANTCSSVAPGASCTLGLRFAPVAAGAATGTLSLTPSAGAAQTVSLAGTGDASAVMTVTTATPLAFGTAETGTNVDRTIGLRNDALPGGNALTVTTSVVAPYSVSANGCTNVAAGATCSITARFSPTIAGASSALITLTPNAGAPVDVSLTGTGQTPSDSTPDMFTLVSQTGVGYHGKVSSSFVVTGINVPVTVTPSGCTIGLSAGSLGSGAITVSAGQTVYYSTQAWGFLYLHNYSITVGTLTRNASVRYRGPLTQFLGSTASLDADLRTLTQVGSGTNIAYVERNSGDIHKDGNWYGFSATRNAGSPDVIIMSNHSGAWTVAGVLGLSSSVPNRGYALRWDAATSRWQSRTYNNGVFVGQSTLSATYSASLLFAVRTMANGDSATADVAWDSYYDSTGAVWIWQWSYNK